MSLTERYSAKTVLPVPADAAFAYHARVGALQRLIPPWESAKIEATDNSVAVGSQVTLKASIMGISVRWIARHTELDPPNLFADTQVSGPFAAWNHRHLFASQDSFSSSLCDQIDYRLPMGLLGKWFGGWKARATIESMFAYRHRITHDDLMLQHDHPMPSMRIAVSGSSGLLGSQLGPMLSVLGHRVVRLVRTATGSDECLAVWNRDEDAAKLNGVDAVVHLAGKSIADARWTDQVKKQIRDSRVTKTRELCEKLAGLAQKPSVLVCASAIGIYSDRGEEILDEDSSVGSDFLAEVAREWEQACQPAVDAGIRVVNARFSIILSARGGALQKMMLPAKFAGGALGSGSQWWSWIALDDALGAIYHAITTDSLRGPVNFVAPEPIRNREFASVLGRVIGRPALFPAPSIALRLALGEMADALLLSSARVVPKSLLQSGYRFRFSDLQETLRYSLGYDRKKSESMDK
jgi:uncharacterized protein